MIIEHNYSALEGSRAVQNAYGMIIGLDGLHAGRCPGVCGHITGMHLGRSSLLVIIERALRGLHGLHLISNF